MKKLPIVLRIGTRPSRLARVQTADAAARLESRLPGISFEMRPIYSSGDLDRITDLRESPADFFTRELDDALRSGQIDLAIHSAKDLPDPLPEDLGLFRFPWREDPRDVLVLALGRSPSDLPESPVIGVSSVRRAAYCETRFPGGIHKMLRGNIEERIAQVDSGSFDLIVMAGAALIRLGLEARITEWIPLAALPVPEGQGYLAATFRKTDARISMLFDGFERGALRGKKVLMTCSEALQQKAGDQLQSWGGEAVPFSLITIQDRRVPLPQLRDYDGLIITSPSAAQSFIRAAGAAQKFPPIMVCGPGTDDVFAAHGIPVALQPEAHFGAEGLIDQLAKSVSPGAELLRLRSDRAGPALADALREAGLQVDDFILYDTVPVKHAELPEFDVAFFASASAVESFIAGWGREGLRDKTVAAIGEPTATALRWAGVHPDVVAEESTVAGTFRALARYFVERNHQ